MLREAFVVGRIMAPLEMSEPMTGTLYGQRDLADITKDLEMRTLFNYIGRVNLVIFPKSEEPFLALKMEKRNHKPKNMGCFLKLERAEKHPLERKPTP